MPGRPQIADRDASVALDWRASTDTAGIDRYIVTRVVDGETTEIETTEPTLDDELPAGTVATYEVLAVDGNGNQSESGRSVTVLAGTSTDQVIVVVSAEANPGDDPHTARLHDTLLNTGYSVTWFEDDVFDANITRSDDLVLLLGDVAGEGFDWNIFTTDSAVMGLKSMFVGCVGPDRRPSKARPPRPTRLCR